MSTPRPPSSTLFMPLPLRPRASRRPGSHAALRGSSIALFLYAACGSPPEADRSPAPGPPVPAGESGTLSLLDGSLAFQPCGSPVPLAVRDDSGRDLIVILDELGYGTGSMHAHLVVTEGIVTELRVAAPESPGCEGVLPDGDLQLRGNEPFWSVTIQGTEAIWRSPETPEGVAFVNGTWEELPDRWRFTAEREGTRGAAVPDGPRPPWESPVLRAELRAELCLDSMSAARYPFSAQVGLGEGTTLSGAVEFEGCGLEGRDHGLP